MRRRVFVWLANRWHQYLVQGLQELVDSLDGVGAWLGDRAHLSDEEWEQELYGDAK